MDNKKEAPQRGRRAAVERLKEGLAGALDAFWFDEGGMQIDHEGDHDYFQEPTAVEPEDVQSAIDEAISTLMSEDLIEVEDGTAPSLSDVIAALLGGDHELAKRAEYFEDLISGYEGMASYEDMKEAYAVLEEIIEGLGRGRRRRRG